MSIPSYERYRFPPEIIAHSVWLYYRFALSFRDIEELLASRGVLVSYEAIRLWCGKFGPEYAKRLRRHKRRLGRRWHVDEVFIRMNGTTHYLSGCSENTVVHWEKSVSVAPVQSVSDRRTMYWTLLAES